MIAEKPKYYVTSKVEPLPDQSYTSVVHYIDGIPYYEYPKDSEQVTLLGKWYWESRRYDELLQCTKGVWKDEKNRDLVMTSLQEYIKRHNREVYHHGVDTKGNPTKDKYSLGSHTPLFQCEIDMLEGGWNMDEFGEVNRVSGRVRQYKKGDEWYVVYPEGLGIYLKCRGEEEPIRLK